MALACIRSLTRRTGFSTCIRSLKPIFATLYFLSSIFIFSNLIFSLFKKYRGRKNAKIGANSDFLLVYDDLF